MRGKIKWLFALVLLLVLIPIALVAVKTGPVSRPWQNISGTPAVRAADMPGVRCEERTFEVQLSADGWRTYGVVGSLCWMGELDGQTLAVTVSGNGYGSVYWDFPYEPDSYSFVRAALRRGLAVFNFDRLGIGRSDRPFGVFLNVDNQAYVLAEIINGLTADYSVGKVVTVGHSFGSTISIAHALTWPENVAGIVLTGFGHNVNPEFGPGMRNKIAFAAFEGPFAEEVVDPTYIVTKPGGGEMFYVIENTDPKVLAVDDLNKQTTALGEVTSAGKYFDNQSLGLDVPVFTLLGDADVVVCGGDLDCKDHAALVAHENQFYSPAACHDMQVAANTGHNSTLHNNGPANIQLMLDWIERRVGIRAGATPSQPCLART